MDMAQDPSGDTAITRPDELLVLVLQGGGALGAYQAGVFEALSEKDALPDWIAGISIGSINAALIAGNPPETRVAALRGFWQTISSLVTFDPPVPGLVARTVFNEASATASALLGIPGFFRPRLPPTYVLPTEDPGALSYYDTAPLRDTLLKFCDFDHLNDKGPRVSLGAVNVGTGNFCYFDTDDVRIGPEHVMASGALPPGFPPVEIDGEWYWDGGIVSNTPLQYVIERGVKHDMVAFQIDLFSARGSLPRTMEEVSKREKDIRFSSRTRLGTDVVKQRQLERRAIHRLLEKLPPDFDDDSDAAFLRDHENDASVTIVHLINRMRKHSRDSKDYEFSRHSVEERWNDGYHDAMCTLQHPAFVNRSKPDRTIEVLDLATGEDLSDSRTSAPGRRNFMSGKRR
ncbi:patatin-like phospholipase family protein [Fulvimarina sp. 2208YS6-2-32]|uniref:Patatin-like phospholipase family protein n=1 Tax=Fulvimarina uroteuthidis TaxID=3098149 RepID=A0ABU5I3P2_9HYPH|nr:patatin-like phospholipase family protein [Fulvimarina sp. 2208YS6-2-32]MDY8109985.1 patatin-like phospholipase family protein [Fulvimarina sp. 2208YS6-2-32]